MQHIAIARSFDHWLCPPSTPDDTSIQAEMQRAHTSHAIAPLLVMSFILVRFLLPATPSGLANNLLLGIIGTTATCVLCLILCHQQRTFLAASIAVTLSVGYIILLTQPLLLTSTAAPITLAICYLPPVFMADVMLRTQACWYVSSAGIAAMLLYQSIFAASSVGLLQHDLSFGALLITGTAILSLGMKKYHLSLQVVDHVHELETLNQHLNTSLEEITVLHEMQATTLQQSEETRQLLDATFNTVQDFLTIIDAQGNLLYANAAAHTMMSHTDNNISYLTMIQNLRYMTPDGESLTLDQTPMMRVLHGEMITEPIKLYVVYPAGNTKMIQASASSLKSNQGAVTGVISIVRDITAEYYNERNIEIMRQIAHACASAADEQAVAQGATDALFDGLSLCDAAIIIRDEARPGYARVLAQRTTTAMTGFVAAITNQAIAPDAPLAALQVLALGEAIFDSAPTVHPTRHESVTTIPLRFNGEVMGVLTLAYENSLLNHAAQPERELFVAVADEVATSLHRARLYEEARRLALCDPLTGLHNHRSLQDILQRELARAATEEQPLSLLMLDIDLFRKLNEAYGHEAGDRALQGVARIIKQCVRPQDVAARYGGEEFVIVMPATASEAAQKMAEQVRAAIFEQLTITDSRNGALLTLSASLGHATFPAHASAAASLLKAADLALYSAKRAGRNAVVAYSPQLLHSGNRDVPHIIPTTAIAAREISLPTGADLDAVQALITAIDLRDGYTAAHSIGVSNYAVAIATALKLPTEHVEALRLGGLIHDVGKIGVPDSVLRKPGKLTEEEWVLMRAHTTMGEVILRSVEQLRHLLPLVRWHHERLDGSGYPDGLKGDDLSQLVRILSVADVFEAFTAERPYHPGRPASEGMRFLHREVVDGHMDGTIVAILEQILTRQGIIFTIEYETAA